MGRILKIHILVFLIQISGISFSQNEASKWYFGFGAALDFMTNPPSIIAGSAMNTIAGSASIADATGNLLFYTDGDTIWNALNLPMANGFGLISAASLYPNFVTNSPVLIVKKPGSNSIYYVFTQSGTVSSTLTTAAGLRYTTVDMSLAAGLGSVVAKNDSLYVGESTFKLAGAAHCNGSDVWIITHDHNSSTNQFMANLVSSAGVSSVAVVSNIGQSGIFATSGQMKVSPNGRKIGYANSYSFRVYDFDNATGIVSNELNLGGPFIALGCEFSNDGTKFFGSIVGPSPRELVQWNLAAGLNSAILASRYSYTFPPIFGPQSISHLQLATDGKIYLPTNNNVQLGVIDLPNLLGPASNFTMTGLMFTLGNGANSLSNFVSGYFRKPISPFTYTLDPLWSCSTLTFSSTELNPGISCAACGNSVISIAWSFDDPISGFLNTSNIFDPIHVFSAPGNYSVRAILNFNCSSDTLMQVITIPGPSPTLSLMGNANLCKGETTTLTAFGAHTYSWSNGSNTPQISFSPSITTIYLLVGTNTVSGCSENSVITVNVSECLGVIENQTGKQFELYPTPTSGNLTLVCAIPFKISLFDQLGVLILNAEFMAGKHSLDISKFSNGIYFLKTRGTNLGQTHKVVKTN